VQLRAEGLCITVMAEGIERSNLLACHLSCRMKGNDLIGNFVWKIGKKKAQENT
jgi:hypothetical protein